MLTIISQIADFFKRKISFSYSLILFLTVVLLAYFFIIRSTGELSKNEIKRCDTCGIGITDLVRQVKKELLALEDSMVNNNENALFRLKDFEMEINFVVRENTSTKLQGNYEVVAVEGSKDYGNEKVQKIILHWETEKPLISAPPDPNYISDTPLDQHHIDTSKKRSK